VWRNLISLSFTYLRSSCDMVGSTWSHFPIPIQTIEAICGLEMQFKRIIPHPLQFSNEHGHQIEILLVCALTNVVAVNQYLECPLFTIQSSCVTLYIGSWRTILAFLYFTAFLFIFVKSLVWGLESYSCNVWLKTFPCERLRLEFPYFWKKLFISYF
jgi:hypothetical protein